MVRRVLLVQLLNHTSERRIKRKKKTANPVARSHFREMDWWWEEWFTLGVQNLIGGFTGGWASEAPCNHITPQISVLLRTLHVTLNMTLGLHHTFWQNLSRLSRRRSWIYYIDWLGEREGRWVTEGGWQQKGLFQAWFLRDVYGKGSTVSQIFCNIIGGVPVPISVS